MDYEKLTKIKQILEKFQKENKDYDFSFQVLLDLDMKSLENLYASDIPNIIELCSSQLTIDTIHNILSQDDLESIEPQIVYILDLLRDLNMYVEPKNILRLESTSYVAKNLLEIEDSWKSDAIVDLYTGLDPDIFSDQTSFENYIKLAVAEIQNTDFDFEAINISSLFSDEDILAAWNDQELKEEDIKDFCKYITLPKDDKKAEAIWHIITQGIPLSMLIDGTLQKKDIEKFCEQISSAKEDWQIEAIADTIANAEILDKIKNGFLNVDYLAFVNKKVLETEEEWQADSIIYLYFDDTIIDALQSDIIDLEYLGQARNLICSTEESFQSSKMKVMLTSEKTITSIQNHSIEKEYVLEVCEKVLHADERWKAQIIGDIFSQKDIPYCNKKGPIERRNIDKKYFLHIYDQILRAKEKWQASDIYMLVNNNDIINAIEADVINTEYVYQVMAYILNSKEEWQSGMIADSSIQYIEGFYTGTISPELLLDLFQTIHTMDNISFANFLELYIRKAFEKQKFTEKDYKIVKKQLESFQSMENATPILEVICNLNYINILTQCENIEEQFPATCSILESYKQPWQINNLKEVLWDKSLKGALTEGKLTYQNINTLLDYASIYKIFSRDTQYLEKIRKVSLEKTVIGEYLKVVNKMLEAMEPDYREEETEEIPKKKTKGFKN